MLQDCPLCKLVKTSQQLGEHCAVIIYGGQKAIVLREHLGAPSPEALREATELIAPRSAEKQVPSTLGTDIREIPGHWGIKVMPVTWLQAPGARYGDGSKPAA